MSDDVLLEAYVWLERARSRAIEAKDENRANRITVILQWIEMRLACGKGLP